MASLVLAIGWVTPWPEAELRPWAAQLALPFLLAALLVGVWPTRLPRRAAELDARLGFGDRLATAWAFRQSSQAIVLLQRSDAIDHLDARSPGSALHWRPSRVELGVLAVLGLVTLVLVGVPSPQQPVLEKRAAEELAVQQANQRLDVLRQEATAAPSLTPEQAQRLDELLRQAQAELNGVRTQREATAILSRATEQVSQQLSDPDAEARDEALAAMSETLASEPLTRALGEALQHEDAQAASDALDDISDQADKLSDVQRQALSRALQRASNVGRSAPQSANALKQAAQALSAGQTGTGQPGAGQADPGQSGAGQPADAASASDAASAAAATRAALAATNAALSQAIQAATADAKLRQTTERLRDLESQLASGTPLSADSQQSGSASDLPGVPSGTPPGMGTPVAIDSGAGRLNDPAAGQGKGAGIGAAGAGAAGQAEPVGPAAENVFVAGRPGIGPADQDLTDQPFSVRGAPRPYREVLGQYAQSGRDYVDRPDVSPAVRDLVKQYFQQLEEGQ
jgi:hypothetical protein